MSQTCRKPSICKLSKENDVKCVLCERNHRPNYKGCGVYQFLRKARFPKPQKPKNIPINSNETQSCLKTPESQTTSNTNKNFPYADMALIWLVKTILITFNLKLIQLLQIV